MKRYIQKLQERPTHHKRRFSMQAAAGITAVAALVWLSTLGVRLTNDIANDSLAQDGGTSNLVAATAMAGSDIANQLGSVQSAFSRITGAASTTTGAAPGAAPAQVLDTAASSAGSGQ